MKPIVGTILAIAFIVLLTGCTSISREDHFHPCVDKKCSLCLGAGIYRCPKCLGRGMIQCSSCSGRGTSSCGKCKGTGVTKANKCDHCEGTGNSRCSRCNNTGMRECDRCRGEGRIRCGTTTHTWVCRKCGERYDYSPKKCAKCGKKK